jgi:hypothetical protein
MNLPLPPREVPRVTSLDGLAPKFRAALEAMLAQMPDAIVGETVRTPERQEYLFGFGRFYDDDRGKVTAASSALFSWHGYGLAADIWKKGVLWQASPTWFRTMGEVAKANGLDWGGDWTVRDLPHVQWGKCKASPSYVARGLYASGDVEAVWKAVGAV